MCRATEGKGTRRLNRHRLGVVCVSSGRGWRCEGVSYSGHASHPGGACQGPWRLVRTAESDLHLATRNRRPSRQEAVLPARYLVAARPNNCMASVPEHALVTAHPSRCPSSAPGGSVEFGPISSTGRRPVPQPTHRYLQSTEYEVLGTFTANPRRLPPIAPPHGHRRDACTLTSPSPSRIMHTIGR
jgi:hypothetical protein